MQEEWRDVVGYEGHYKVSSLGRVKSLQRIVYRGNGEPNPVKERILKPFLHPNGYLGVNLRPNKKTHHIQRLVAIAFYGYKPGMHADHINNDKKDNSVANIRWLTPQENLSRRRFQVGQEHHASKFTSNQVIEIIKEHNKLLSDPSCRSPVSLLSKKYNVNYYTIMRIIKKMTYRNVE